MKDRETARKRKYGESKKTGIMMATVPHVTSGLGLKKFQADGFLLTRVYIKGTFYFRFWLQNSIGKCLWEARRRQNWRWQSCIKLYNS